MIDIKNLNKTFGQVQALKNVSLKIEKGEMVALIGASGSGKSTLIRHLSGLMTSDKVESRVLVNKAAIQTQGCLAKSIRTLRREIGVVFQQFNLVGRLSVHQNVLLGALGRTSIWRALFMAFSPEDKNLANEALKKVGIFEKAGQRASTLSGGQQQRAAIARTLVQKAKLILADEPIASLDPESSKRVMDVLRNLNLEENLTVVVTLHQVDYALKYCPRVVAMKNGEIAYDGPGTALTPGILQQIYGSECEDMFQEKMALPADNSIFPINTLPFASQAA